MNSPGSTHTVMKTSLSPLLNIIYVLISLIHLPLFASSAQDSPLDQLFTQLSGEHGKFLFNTRLRHEGVEQDGFMEDAEALTIRTRLGYKTHPINGLSFLAEGEFIYAINDSYNAAGRNPATRNRPIVADPEIEELNQLLLLYEQDGFLAKIGRQILALDDHRWIGHVGWRQNIQTMDAILASSELRHGLKVTYAYIDQVNRIFGRDWPDRAGPVGHFDSRSHLLNISKDFQFGKLTAFGYLLDLENAATLSSQTFGILLKGSKAIEKFDANVNYQASFARQSDYADNVNAYTADYIALDLSYQSSSTQIGFGYEILGSDGGRVAISAPLATLHKFNGWADAFLSTPTIGLHDRYFYISEKFPIGKGLNASLIYHQFESDRDSVDLGNELNMLLTYPLAEYLNATLKYADYNTGDAGSPTSRRKIILQIDMVY